MPSHVLLSLCATATLGIAAVVCAGISLARVQELSLPFPASMPALNILLPFLAATAVPLSRRLTQQVKGPLLRLLSSYLASTSMLAPFTLFVLSLVYALPSTLRSCAADQQWQRMFQNKDVSGIRTIQARLQCCGFNSMHDRAWPFPSRDTDARTCERTLGYIMACGIVWRQEETFAAVLSAIASLLNWLLLVRSSCFSRNAATN